jgi:Type I restriction modification DNA specificity domain.
VSLKKVAQENDILISVRAPIGAINYSKEKCCIGRGLAALTVDKTKISEKLLFGF